MLICRRDQTFAGRKSLRWCPLAGYPLIYTGFDHSNRLSLGVALAGKIANLQIYFEVQRSATAVGLVADGVGAAVPRLAMQPGAYPELRTIALVDRSLRVRWFW